ncbi:glycosyltransferase WbsX family protein [Prevotella sp. SGI.027]|nr:glycoside hydrolase family 99-like domain-containing protein [Prevotellaceae bacterium]MDY3104800.1 glycoside hydrolase family 99-like domain-containing protein [Prevotella sp.]MDY5843887.1 glycoside hydrolase family 99-like domain-containing protein [Prevotella sp.]
MKARVIAYYLPQFHPIPENDKYWGKGFTEWTNVAKAKPLFKGHYQPRIPADLGFYDLRLPEVREQQAQMARETGIEGFCYWHYWFGNGKRLLQRPFNEVLQSGKPDFPFCLAWANHSWKTSTWENGGKDRMIVEQRYLGEEDYTMHFQEVLPAFRDKRYITIEGKPLFTIFDPYNFRDVSNFIKTWQRLAKENGLKDIYFIAMCNSTSTLRRNADGALRRVTPNLQSSEKVYNDLLNLGFDGINSFGKSRAEMLCMGKYARIAKKLLHQYLPFLPTHCINYEKIMQHFFAPEDSWQNVYPSIFPQWDRTPRAGNSEGVYVNATPTTFKKHIQDALNVIKNKDMEHRILFLRAWNEWGEGNYVEPDLKYGHGFLDAIKETIV